MGREMTQVENYTDGGCEPNPGPGGDGVVWLHPKKYAGSQRRLSFEPPHPGFLPPKVERGKNFA